MLYIPSKKKKKKLRLTAKYPIDIGIYKNEKGQIDIMDLKLYFRINWWLNLFLDNPNYFSTIQRFVTYPFYIGPNL